VSQQEGTVFFAGSVWHEGLFDKGFSRFSGLTYFHKFDKVCPDLFEPNRLSGRLL
jgi:hypothetical protein